jgi:formate dehydrogenase major subunit
MKLWDRRPQTSRSETDPAPDAPDFSICPEQLQKAPPCQLHCPNSGDIRGWLGIIAQREKTGLSLEEAYDRAWRRLVEFNPMPATIGRICPHPCETACTRSDKDEPISINAMERFLGDWGLQRGLRFTPLDGPGRDESVGVIGSGPAGISFAYQMARRKYPVTLYERSTSPGGMLRNEIPSYRLPVDVLEREIEKIVDLGVDLQLGMDVGPGLSLEVLRQRHRLLFLGMGAQHARGLGIPGEEGAGVWSGIEFLRLKKEGRQVSLGSRVAVIGGGNTAIDSARSARREGAEVRLLYRRSRDEMPAADQEIEDAITEGVSFEFLVAPLQIIRDDQQVRAVEVQQMALGDPDATGRRKPVAMTGDTRRVDVDAVIVAVSQDPEFDAIPGLPLDHGWLKAGDDGRLGAGLWAGGDDRGLGIASLAISQGRHAAEAADAELRGSGATPGSEDAATARDQVKTDFYQPRLAVHPPRRPEEAWLSDPDAEITGTLTSEEAQYEADRCLSCGLCIGCEQCWMYCNAGGFVRLSQAETGTYYALLTDICEGCGKCIEVCPTGFLSPRPSEN